MMDSTGGAASASAIRTVRITAPFETAWLDRLQSQWPQLHVDLVPAASARDLATDSWQAVDVLYTSFATPLPTPEQAPRLRWVQLYSAGIDQIAEAPLVRSEVVFTTASGIHATTMAEYVSTVMLAWYHRLPTVLEWQARSQWPSSQERSMLFTGEELRGKTLGIVGYGSIGRQTARLASAFGMRIIAMQRGTEHRDRGWVIPGTGDPEGALPERYFAPEQLHAMLSECDIALIVVPLTSHTRRMIDESALGAMKPTSFLINVARGDVCDETALLRALESRRIGGAALDVFHQEPLPPDHPFWRLPNVVISPHISSLTPRYAERARELFEENLRRYIAGGALFNVVDIPLGY